MSSRIAILLSTSAAVALVSLGGGSPRSIAPQTDSAPRAAVWNGLGVGSGSARDELKAMLLKYTARCALPASQVLDATDPDSGKPRRFPGGLGLAPEWLKGTCGADCQEKVSACLGALSNRTGQHVKLSLLSAAPALDQAFRPSESDVAFPHQEGAFFGNLFSGEVYACSGRDADKAPQVKRFCAVSPESCNGLMALRSAGRCEDVCEMTCTELSDGTRRCAAASCRDPGGRVWPYPITVYLRNKIEAGNADDVRNLVRHDEGLEGLGRGGEARFDLVDFGARRGSISQLGIDIAARSRGRLEVWLDGTRRLGAFDVAPSDGIEREQTVPIRAGGISGRHSVVVKVVSGKDIGRLSTVELR